MHCKYLFGGKLTESVIGKTKMTPCLTLDTSPLSGVGTHGWKFLARSFTRGKSIHALSCFVLSALLSG